MTQLERGESTALDSPLASDSTAEARHRIWLISILSVVGFLGVWWLAIANGLLSQRLFATPPEVASWLWDWFLSGRAWGHIWATLRAAFIGAAAGLILGSIVAAIFAFVPLVAEVMDPYMAIVNGIPKIVLAPLIILVFGLGIWSKVAIAGLLVFFVTFFNIYSGLRSVDRGLVANLRVLGARRRNMAIDLYIPATFTWIFSTLRVSIGFALIGVIVGEFVGSNQGVGYVIKIASEQLVPEQLFGGLTVLAIIAMILDFSLSRVERRFSAWSVF